MAFHVINSIGKKESFSEKKIYDSAKRAGASRELAEKTVGIIRLQAYPGIKTSEIFSRIKGILNQEAPKAAFRFNLKEGMKKLGPTGFPFEKFIGAIFSKQGFEIKLNQQVLGNCCRHEIDFLAQKDNLLYIGECKYRNLSGGRVHSSDALANYARFLDIKKGRFLNKKQFKDLKIKSLLVTNTKFTTRTIKYSECVGVELLGWRYPSEGGLEYLIEKQKLYPITVLPSLNKHLAEILVSKKIMLARDILKKPPERLAKITKLSKKYLESLLKEAKILLGEEY